MSCSEKSNSSLYKSPKGMLAASCFTYFLAGVPLIYSSQEIGYMQSINFCVPSDRSVLMDWTSGAETLAAYKQMMKTYHETAKLRGGEQKRYTSNSKVGVFSYESTEGTMLVIVNLSGDTQTLAVPSAFINKSVKNLLTGVDEEKPLTRNMDLEPYEYRIVRVNL